MVIKRPIFLFAFANDVDRTLRLGDEDNVCWNELRSLHEKGIVECRRMGFPTLEQIYLELNQCKDQVYLFHYGGHSNSEIIQIPRNESRAKHLGAKLGMQKNIKLIFLNGCKNYSQVQQFFDSGIPSVIATNAPISDGRAILLAQQFYQALANGYSIVESFESAKSFIFDKFPELKSSYRDLGFTKEESSTFSWGLYSNPNLNSTLNWKIGDVANRDHLDLLSSLRSASRNRYQRFINSGGRFYYLKIDDAILTGIRGISRDHKEFIETILQIDDQDLPLSRISKLLWDKKNKHALIVGSGGMGKTVSLLRLWELFLNNDNLYHPVPVFIQLNEFNIRPEKNFISNYIKDFYSIELEKLIKSPIINEKNYHYPSVILLLDGLNEVTADVKELILEINRLRKVEDYPGIQIVLTSRTDFRETFQWQDLCLLRLLPLTNKQVSSYLNKEIPKDNRLLELLRNPMMLTIYSLQNELPEQYYSRGLLKTEISSQGEMLSNFEKIQRIKIEENYATNLRAQAYRRFILEHILPYIGWRMEKEGLFSILDKASYGIQVGLYDILDQGIAELISDDFFETFEYYNAHLEESYFEERRPKLFWKVIHKIIINELAILVEEDNNYRFLHQSFRDFFAARHIQNKLEISIKQLLLPQVLRLSPLSFNIRLLLGELEGEHTNVITWNEKEKRFIWNKESFFIKNKLFGVFEICREVFDQMRLGYVIWNLLTIWKEMRFVFAGASFDNIDLRGFSFNGSYVSLPTLPTTFDNSRLNGANFFSQAHSGSINCVSYSTNGLKIITASQDKSAKIWDTISGKVHLTLIGHGDSINYCEFSTDGKKVITASDDEKIKVWSVETGECLLTLIGHHDRVFFSYFVDSAQRSLRCLVIISKYGV